MDIASWLRSEKGFLGCKHKMCLRRVCKNRDSYPVCNEMLHTSAEMIGNVYMAGLLERWQICSTSGSSVKLERKIPPADKSVLQTEFRGLNRVMRIVSEVLKYSRAIWLWAILKYYRQLKVFMRRSYCKINNIAVIKTWDNDIKISSWRIPFI